MTAKLIFDIANGLTPFAWLVLLIAPKWDYTFKLLTTIWVCILAILYIVMLLRGGDGFLFESFGSIEGIRGLFQNDYALTAGWIHYLAFDLLVGCSIVKQGLMYGIPRWLYSLALPLTFMFGPVGYLFFKITTLKYTWKL